MIAWRGPSRIDGRPIVVILTGLGRTSQNAKTGAMVQSWILVERENPLAAIAAGRDASICGSCPLRGANGKGRACYVDVSRAPLGIWRKYQRGGYAEVAPEAANAAILRTGRGLRLGAYGDPAAVPEEVWQVLARGVRRVTGYSHGAGPWGLAMASVDSADEASHAAARGLRYFRVMRPGETVMAGEILCPASTESEAIHGRRLTCAQCGLCDGLRRAATLPLLPSVAIYAHGRGKGNV